MEKKLFVVSRGRSCKLGDRTVYYDNDGRYIESLAKYFKECVVWSRLVLPNDREFDSSSKYNFEFSNAVKLVFSSINHKFSLVQIIKNIFLADVVLVFGPSLLSLAAIIFGCTMRRR